MAHELRERLIRHAHDLIKGGTNAGELRDDLLLASQLLSDQSATDKVSAPPPSENDYQVSLEGAPDFDLMHFSGGIESIERKGSLLIFQFTNGGRLCVPGAVTYHAPERH